MNRLPVNDGPAGYPAAIDWAICPQARVRDCALGGRSPSEITIKANDLCISCVTEAAPRFQQPTSSTGWISVGELAMTPKISLVAVCCSNDSLSSLEQPDVLNGDHSLIGKGCQPARSVCL